MTKIKEKLSKILKRGEKLYNTTVLTLVFFMVFAISANATEPVIVSGTKKLFADASIWLSGLIPVGAGLMLGFQAFQKSLTDDTAVIAEKNRFMKNVLIGAAIATSASGLTALILNTYYKS